ncbi:putative quinol monooxygenase [Labedaea rhizosphaerae]|uniref:Quinol monooxygenase YgiN n=1 Tax=Labedaea rhizosphaerae TaxID=598644 RepID=A0A4R6RVR4_LABRH|nr:putative quinol monooxygenase [Labedaea rhizosphaerae]TDP91060.1 quinol monooxygenase YgiN [Labedaea rhizosphaerae]
MIFIVVKFTAKPEHADQWLARVDEFTQATRAEPGNLFFEWSRSVDDPNTFVLVEAFADGDAGAAHVQSDHFKAGIATLSSLVASTPQIVNVEAPGDGWSVMAEVQPTA